MEDPTAAAVVDPHEAYQQHVDALEKAHYLTPLPAPPAEDAVAPYNTGDGNCLVRDLKRGHTVHHCLPVAASDTMALTCYVEVDGGDYHDMLYIAALDPARPSPTGTPLKDHPHAPYSIQVAAPTVVRVCLCPISKMLIVSHPAEDFKLYSVGLPPTSTGQWVLALHRNSGYIRIFDCARTAQTHWRYPTMMKP